MLKKPAVSNAYRLWFVVQEHREIPRVSIEENPARPVGDTRYIGCPYRWRWADDGTQGTLQERSERHDDRGWRARFYKTGMEHSPISTRGRR